MSGLNQIVQGVLLGGSYAMLACGLSFMFGVMRIINLAHGSLAVAAAYMVFYLAERFGLNPFVGLVFAMPAMAAIGWALQRLVLERSHRAGELVPILATFGLAVMLDNAMFSAFGADTRSLAPHIESLAYDGLEVGGIVVGHLSLVVLASAIAVLGGLQLVLVLTPLGRRIRAVADDATTLTRLR